MIDTAGCEDHGHLSPDEITAREVFASSEELIWPEKIVCGHADEPQTTT
jgi:hypothetical protein